MRNLAEITPTNKGTGYSELFGLPVSRAGRDVMTARLHSAVNVEQKDRVRQQFVLFMLLAVQFVD